jgi:two-component system NarL family sensor kinase
MDSTYIQVIASDISKRVEFERQLQLNEARMQQLAATVMIGHEDERRFIAHELHDESSQMLAAMAMELDAARKILENDPEAASARILTAGQMAADAISDLRRLSHLLRSPMLETLGLGPALEELARQVAEQSGLRIDVAARPVEERDRTAQTVLYRCAQEALTNTVRHANASRVAITLGQDEKSIVLSIQDDGSGFIPTEIPQSGIGLVAIRERLGSLGGHLKVDSTPGSGTTIVAAMPRINGGASE